MPDASISSNTNPPPASIALTQIGIDHRLFIHEGTVTSFEQAARERGQRPAQIVRSILFQVTPGEFVLVLMAGPAQVDWKKLRQIAKRSRVRMATEEEVLEVTGYQIGTVSPFGVKNQTRVLIDASVLREEELSIGSGVRNKAILLKSADLRRGLNGAEIVSVEEDAPGV